MFPVTSPYTPGDFPLQESDGSQQITVDSHKINRVVISIPAAMPDMVSLLQQIKTDCGA